MIFKAGQTSFRGKRDSNQDAVFSSEGLGIFAIADGMGGLAHGERISKASVEVVEDRAEALHALVSQRPRSGVDARQELFSSIETLFDDAGGAIYEEVESSGQRMGTTLTMAVMAAGGLVIGHVGDTRAYRVHGSSIEVLTHDHSVAALQFRRGKLDEEGYWSSPMRHVLYEFLGHEPDVDTDIVESDIEPGDTIILATDGVWEFLDDEVIFSGIAMNDPQAAADAYVRHALRQGSTDNCSAVVIHAVGRPKLRHRRISIGRTMARSRLFADMRASDVRLLSPYLSPRRVEPGEFIIREGELGRELYLIASGRCEVQRHGVVLVELGPGAHFGELALCGDAHRSASVVAVDDVAVVVLDRDGLDLLGEKRPDLANMVLERLLSFVTTRLIDMTERAVAAEQGQR